MPLSRRLSAECLARFARRSLAGVAPALHRPRGEPREAVVCPPGNGPWKRFFGRVAVTRHDRGHRPHRLPSRRGHCQPLLPAMTGNAAPCPGRCCRPMTQWSATLGLGAIADFLTRAGRGCNSSAASSWPSPDFRRPLSQCRHPQLVRHAATQSTPSTRGNPAATATLRQRPCRRPCSVGNRPVTSSDESPCFVRVFGRWPTSPRSRVPASDPCTTGRSSYRISCSRFALRFSEGPSFAQWAFSRAPIWDRPARRARSIGAGNVPKEWTGLFGIRRNWTHTTCYCLPEGNACNVATHLFTFHNLGATAMKNYAPQLSRRVQRDL